MREGDQDAASSGGRLGALFVGKRFAFLALSTLLTLALALGILRSSFDTSLSALLSQSDPYLTELDELQQAFPTTLQVNFAFIPSSGSVFAPLTLAALDDLGSRFRELPSATRISSLLDYVSPESQVALFQRPYSEYSQDELDAIEQLAIADRLLTSNLMAPDARLVFSNISIAGENLDPAGRVGLAEAVAQLRDELREAHPNVSIHANSEVLFEQYNRDAMLSDLTGLLPFVILICVITICYCFRSATLGIAIFSHVIFSMLSTVGTLGFLGIAFNSISVIAPLVVVIIAVANSVHIISIFKQSLSRGMDVKQAMSHSIDHNFTPVSLAALTTIIGFSSLNLCSSPAIQDFGRIVAIGIVFAYFFTFTQLPVLLIWLSSKVNPDKANSPFLQSTLDGVCRIVKAHDKPIFWATSTLALVTLALLPLNETDFNRLDFVAEDSDLGQYYSDVGGLLERGPGLIYGLDFGDDSALNLAALTQLDQLTNSLLEDPEVESVASLLDVVKTLNRFQHGGDENYYRLPEDEIILASFLSLYGMVQSPDFPLQSFVTDDGSLLRVIVNAPPLSNQGLIDLDNRLSEQFTSQLPSVRLVHGSSLLLFARMDELVTIELLQGYSVSLLLITLSLIIGLRSFFFGLLSVIPNLLPATMVFGIWALLVGQLDPFVMMLFSISIGLVVDDTVHILSHYLKFRREGIAQPEAIEGALRIAGPALTITTLVLALGTLILIGASTLYFQQAAKLLVPIVVLALVLDFFYLPTILKRSDRLANPR